MYIKIFKIIPCKQIIKFVITIKWQNIYIKYLKYSSLLYTFQITYRVQFSNDTLRSVLTLILINVTCYLFQVKKM